MSTLQPIRVMLVDDHLMVRDGLKVFLSLFDDIEVMAEAENGRQALAACQTTLPDVVLMDVIMPEMDGATATAQLLARHPTVKIIALTSFVEEELVQKMIQAGAIGYLLKDVHSDRLAEAIRAAHHGHSMIDSAAAQVLVRSSGQPTPPGDDLTPREREVLTLLADGKTNKEIAELLSISTGTARLHVSNILGKLGVTNRTEAARLALQHNLVS